MKKKLLKTASKSLARKILFSSGLWTISTEQRSEKYIWPLDGDIGPEFALILCNWDWPREPINKDREYVAITGH